VDGAGQQLAPSTLEIIYVIFASIMGGAVRDSYSRKTPCNDIRLPEISRTVIHLLTPAEVLAAMPGRYRLRACAPKVPCHSEASAPPQLREWWG
jgi:hypothetical protein